MATLRSFMNTLDEIKPSDEKMPVLFIGHGSPMNAIEHNEYHNSWVELGKKLSRPKAILTISAHWLTQDTRVTAMERPKTIHDFGGFPKELFAQQYPAPGSPDFAELTKKLVTKTTVKSDFDWGLDHGTWSFLLPMYPRADIPVYQLSLDYYKPMQYHYELAEQLSELRRKGVMIIGSGNIVHNLGMLNFSGKPYDWAIEFDQKMKEFITDKNHEGIMQYEKLGAMAKLAVPTHDHFLPLIYSIAVQEMNEEILFFNEKTDMGSVSMRSFKLG
ncbi:MAG: 4,5-DOPA dioxygenase extradiol [Bacteroidota bacterium]